MSRIPSSTSGTLLATLEPKVSKSPKFIVFYLGPFVSFFFLLFCIHSGVQIRSFSSLNTFLVLSYLFFFTSLSLCLQWFSSYLLFLRGEPLHNSAREVRRETQSKVSFVPTFLFCPTVYTFF